MKRNTRTLAVCSVCAALGVVLLWLGSLIEVLDLSVVCVASLLVVFVIMEYGTPWQFLLWLVTGILALVLLPNKFCAVEYLFFGGVFPIIKQFAEKLPRTYAAIVKGASLAVMCVGLVWSGVLIFGMEDLRLPLVGIVTRPVYTAVLSAMAFLAGLLYDCLITRLARLYLYKLRPRLSRILDDKNHRG